MLQLNAAQQTAIDCSEGAMLIVAGPGTGKTRVIISKIEALLVKGYAPASILAVTFSRKAAREMLDRLSQNLSLGVVEQVNISTLHSFCVSLVERHGFRLGFHQKPRIMTESQAQVFFREVAARLPLQPFVKTSNFEPVMSDLLAFFQDCKDEGIWPEELLEFAVQLPETTADEHEIKAEWMALSDVYNAYQSFCFEKGFFDFGDSVLSALRLLQDFSVVREEIHSEYKAILVDEFQDTNWTQIQLLRLLAGPATHVAVVGDDDQSIYRFRGASYSAFRFFNESFPDAKVVEMNTTFRLSKEIAEVASQLIRANGRHRFLPDKKLSADKLVHQPVRVLQFQNFQAESDAICNEIENLLNAGVSPSEIGVLTRAHSHSDDFMQVASRKNLPLHRATGDNFFQQDVIKDVLAYFRLISDPRDSISFLRLLDGPFLRLSADEIYSFCRWACERVSTYLDALPLIHESPISDSTKAKLLEFFNRYKKAYAEAAQKSASEILLDLLEISDCLSYLFKSQQGDLKILGSFFEQLQEWEQLQKERNFRSLVPFFESLAQSSDSLSSSSEAEKDPHKISVLSLHASKGLEFEHVYILSLVGRRFPSTHRKAVWMVPNALRRETAPTKETHLEEERRLLYVGMTRAKKNLTLSTVERKGTKPSLFLTEDLSEAKKNSSLLLWEFRPSAEDPATRLTKPQIFERTSCASPNHQSEQTALSLSFTQLDKYETCPLAYRLKYELKVPVRVSATLTVGAAVHYALEKFFQGLKKEIKPTSEDLVKYFEEKILEEKKINFELSDRDLELGRTKLKAFYDFHQGNFPVPYAIEKDFVFNVGPHRVRGKIDRIDTNSDGTFSIIDYKTGKAKAADLPESKKFAEESLQFSIYALAARESLSLQVRDLVFYYVYENSSLTTTRSTASLEETKMKILGIAENIQKKIYEPSPGFHCRYCEYKNICPSATL